MTADREELHVEQKSAPVGSPQRGQQGLSDGVVSSPSASALKTKRRRAEPRTPSRTPLILIS